MPTCYLHIGMHKTGTTALQRHMAAAREAAKADGLVFPDLLGENHSLALSVIFRADDPQLARTMKRRGNAASQPELDAAFEALCTRTAADGDDLLLSGEGLSHFPEPAVERVRARLERHFDRVVVLAFARPPLSFARSAAQQRVRYRLTLADCVARPPLGQYRQRFEPYRKVFGEADVRLGLYHRAAMVDGCVLATAVSMLDGARPNLARERAAPRNTSVSMTAVKLLSAMHGAPAADPFAALPAPVAAALMRKVGRRRAWLGPRPSPERLAGAAKAVVVGVPGPPFRLPAEVAEAVLVAGAEDGRWLAQALGLALDEYDDRRDGEPLSLSDCARWSAEEIDQTLAHIAGA